VSFLLGKETLHLFLLEFLKLKELIVLIQINFKYWLLTSFDGLLSLGAYAFGSDAKSWLVNRLTLIWILPMEVSVVLPVTVIWMSCNDVLEGIVGKPEFINKVAVSLNRFLAIPAETFSFLYI
jgi:hypothetical protein